MHSLLFFSFCIHSFVWIEWVQPYLRRIMIEWNTICYPHSHQHCFLLFLFFSSFQIISHHPSSSKFIRNFCFVQLILMEILSLCRQAFIICELNCLRRFLWKKKNGIILMLEWHQIVSRLKTVNLWRKWRKINERSNNHLIITNDAS